MLKRNNGKRTIVITEKQMQSLRELIEKSSTHYRVKNASPSDDSEGSMIDYWEERKGIDLSSRLWLCPKCGGIFKRDLLDGAHVVLSIFQNGPQYITPLCQTCNREKDDKPFWVLKDNVVSAP